MIAALQAARELGELIALSEEAARDRILGPCAREAGVCPRCGGRRLYELSGGRARCAACRYTHRPLSGRWFSSVRFSPKNWLIILKCFETGLSAEDALLLTGLPRSSLYRAYKTIRGALQARDERDPLAGEDVERRFDRLLAAVAARRALRPSAGRGRGSAPRA